MNQHKLGCSFQLLLVWLHSFHIVWQPMECLSIIVGLAMKKSLGRPGDEARLANSCDSHVPV